MIERGWKWLVFIRGEGNRGAWGDERAQSRCGYNENHQRTKTKVKERTYG